MLKLCFFSGALALPLIGVGAAALVAAAMSQFGTVVAGVGTMHANAAAGGVASILQITAATLGANAVTSAIGAVSGKRKMARNE